MSQYPASPYGAPAHGGQRSQQPMFPNNVAAAAGLGALIGATGAAAHAIHQVREGNMTNQQAVAHTAKEAAGTGLATAAAVAAVGSASMSGALGMVGLLAVGTGVKYLWDQSVCPACESITSNVAGKVSAALDSGKDAAASED